MFDISIELSTSKKQSEMVAFFCSKPNEGFIYQQSIEYYLHRKILTNPLKKYL